MLSQSYIKIVPWLPRPFFPVELKDLPGFQETLSCKYVSDSLYYELSYVEGPLLLKECERLKASESALAGFLNRYLDWYRENVLFELEDGFLMVNGDSNAANIVVGSKGFVHIDNQTDFLRTTKNIIRPYLPLVRLLSDIDKLSRGFIEKLRLPSQVKAFALKGGLADFQGLSELSDEMIWESRDALYEAVLLKQMRPPDTPLSRLLIGESASFSGRFPKKLSHLIGNDFLRAKRFIETYALSQLSSG